MPKALGIKWDEIEDLGKVPDSVLAERLKCGSDAVARARYKRNIPCFAVCIDWDAISDLATAPYVVLADRLGCSVSTVRRACSYRGIRKIKCIRVNWKTVFDLGKTSDAVIAKRLNCSTDSVANARMRRRIPAYKKTEICHYCGKSFTAKNKNAVLCSRRCLSLSAHTCRVLNLDSREDLNPYISAAFRQTIEYRRRYVHSSVPLGIDWDNVTTLGILPDRQIAEQLGCAYTTVVSNRIKRGIPCVSKIDWDNIPGLGILTDRVIANQLGCTRSSVTRARVSRGIQSSQKRKSENFNTKEKNNAEQQD